MSMKFKIAAKTDIGLVRQNNEDNFQASADLSKDSMQWINNQECNLGDKGALLVVADGMGGMNAGEVASEVAINTVRDCFSPEKLTREVIKDDKSIEEYMNQVIVDADSNIKKVAKERPETKGMGTTIVIAWLINQRLYVSWCGDSRAYIYNKVSGLQQITKDHSYVQTLVDKGVLTKEEAFDFPESNIITRSLSDSSSKAKPECLEEPYLLCNDDIVLLCTDGLSGMIRDSEIANIISENTSDMGQCVDKLVNGALDAAGADNVTLCVCHILSGASVKKPIIEQPTHSENSGVSEEGKSPNKKKPWIIAIILFILIAGGYYYYVNQTPAKPTILLQDSNVKKHIKKDSVKAEITKGKKKSTKDGQTKDIKKTKPEIGKASEKEHKKVVKEDDKKKNEKREDENTKEIINKDVPSENTEQKDEQDKLTPIKKEQKEMHIDNTGKITIR